MSESHINVTLMAQGLAQGPLDMRLPRFIETRRLIIELERIFGCELSKKKYQLRVVNKGLLIDEGKQLSNYPVTDGDTLEIMEI